MYARVAIVTALLIVGIGAPASAQFGVGGRLSMVRVDDAIDDDSKRFLGAHIRALLSPRTGIEVSLERRTDTNDEETLRVRQIPIQASLLLFPVRSRFAPYFLGGGGWYTHRVELLAGSETISSESTRTFGWHAGLGAELRMGRHAALHADYRYTDLDFGDDDDDDDDDGGFVSRLLPSHRGSMWSTGLTIYF